MEQETVLVPEELVGVRLDKVLSELFSDLSLNSFLLCERMGVYGTRNSLSTRRISRCAFR